MEELFYDIFSSLPRQGPGSTKLTKKAAGMINKIPNEPFILDIGCGTGTQTLELANYFGGHITAVDNHQPYLDMLQALANLRGFSDNISCVNGNMLDMDFVSNKYDLIWAEGSIYIIGFEKGISAFKNILNPNGYVAVTEITWIKNGSPEELKEFWEREYPSMDTIENNLRKIKKTGYNLSGYFVLPDSAWWDEYYNPLEKRLTSFREKYYENEYALVLIEYIQNEIDVFKKFSDYYGYVFYVMQLKQ